MNNILGKKIELKKRDIGHYCRCTRFVRVAICAIHY